MQSLARAMHFPDLEKCFTLGSVVQRVYCKGKREREVQTDGEFQANEATRATLLIFLVKREYVLRVNAQGPSLFSTLSHSFHYLLMPLAAQSC